MDKVRVYTSIHADRELPRVRTCHPAASRDSDDPYVLLEVGRSVIYIAVAAIPGWVEVLTGCLEVVPDHDPMGLEGHPGETEVCHHGNPPEECDACMQASDHEHDKEQERQAFGR